MKIKNCIIDIIFWCIFLIITVLLSSNGVLVCDDIWSSKLFNGGIELSKGIAVSHGSWLYPLEKVLFVILPHYLNINIQDWAINFGCFLKTITVISFLLFFYKFTDGYNLSKIKRYLICACSYFIVYIFCSRYRFVDFIIYEGFLRFIFSSLLLIWFIYCIYSVYIKELKLKKYYFGAFISGAFLSSANIENAFISFALLLGYFIPVAVKFSYVNDMLKRFSYIRDKIMLFYNYQNKEAILPKCFHDDHDYAHMWLMYDNYPVSLQDYVLEISGLNFIDDINAHSSFTFYKEVTYFKNFGYENYGNENYISSKKALEIFVNEGGSYDEAFNDKIKFKNLENIDFVLNKSK